MKHQCEYCDSYLEDTQEVCPNCGAVNPAYKRTSDKTPKTIAELQQWYTDHNLPAPEVTRFFIGQNYQGPKAFGIYRDGERFIVYKNKDDGSRAVRYDGGDEAYAVNEIYLKLKEVIGTQKSNQSVGKVAVHEAKKKSPFKSLVWIVVIIMIIIGYFSPDSDRHQQGYYTYGGQQYYYMDNNWYGYDSHGGWSQTSVDSDFEQSADDYYESYGYDSSYNSSDFSHTDYYSNWQDSQWDDDSDWDFGGDSWDSDFGGDWGSDW